MSVVLFDTHAFVKRLTAVGMTEAQAEVLADQQARLIDERLATKSDIADLAAKMAALATKAEMATLATKAELSDVKADILKWMFGTIGFQTIVILGAVLALSRFAH